MNSALFVLNLFKTPVYSVNEKRRYSVDDNFSRKYLMTFDSTRNEMSVSWSEWPSIIKGRFEKL